MIPAQELLIFDGPALLPCDAPRLTSQFYAVRELMQDGQWRTPGEIIAVIGRGTDAGVTARLRDNRKERFGGHIVNSRRRGHESAGLFEYQLILREPTQ